MRAGWRSSWRWRNNLKNKKKIQDCRTEYTGGQRWIFCIFFVHMVNMLEISWKTGKVSKFYFYRKRGVWLNWHVLRQNRISCVVQRFRMD